MTHTVPISQESHCYFNANTVYTQLKSKDKPFKMYHRLFVKLVELVLPRKLQTYKYDLISAMWRLPL